MTSVNMKRFSEQISATFSVILSILIISLPGTGRGDETEQEISLYRCIELALENPEIMDSIYYEVDIAEIELDRTDSQLYPHLGARYNYDYDFKQEDTYSGIEILLDGPYLQIPQNIVKRKISKAKLKAAEYKSRRERAHIIYEVARNYCELMKLQALETRARDMLKIAEMEKKIVDIRKKEGLTLKPEMKEIGRKIITLKKSLESTRRSLKEGRLALSRSLSIEADFKLAPLDHQPAVGSDPERLIAWARNNRSDARAIRELIDLLKSSIKLATFDRWIPEPELYLGYGSPTSGDASDWYEKEGFYIRTALSYTLWDWGEKASRIAQAKRELERSLAALKAMPRKIRLEVAKSYAGLEKSWAKTENALRNRKTALEKLRIFRAQHEEEPASEYNAARANLELQQAEWELTIAISDETIALVELAKATELEPVVLSRILSDPEAEIQSPGNEIEEE